MKRYIRAAVQPLEDVPVSIKEEMARDPKTRPSVLVELAEYATDHPMVAALVANPNTPPEALDKAIRLNLNDSWAIGQLVKHPNTPASAEYYIAERGNNFVKEALLSGFKLGNIDPEVLWILYDDASPRIRAEVASNPNTPAEILKLIAKDPDTIVRFNVAHNPNTPKDIAEHMLKSDVFDSIGGSDYWEDQEELAKNPRTPSEFLRKLADSSHNAMAVKFAASNPNMPTDVLERLAEDHFYQTSVAANPSTPPELLDKLSRCRDNYIRRMVARNPNASVATLRRLSKSSDYATCLDVANNPNTPINVLQKYIDGEFVGAISTAARNNLASRRNNK